MESLWSGWSNGSRDLLADVATCAAGARTLSSRRGPTSPAVAPMTRTGYSDRINHALAFSAKHHHQEVWKGARPPYATAGPNVAIILTRYGREDDTVIAGIVLEVVEDYIRHRYTSEMLERRVADKFGADVLQTVLMVAERSHDDDGVELAPDERRGDALHRLADSSEEARWVRAAATVHEGGALVADLRRTRYPESVWRRLAAGPNEAVESYRRMHDRLAEVGFEGAIIGELEQLVGALEEMSASA